MYHLDDFIFASAHCIIYANQLFIYSIPLSIQYVQWKPQNNVNSYVWYISRKENVIKQSDERRYICEAYTTEWDGWRAKAETNDHLTCMTCAASLTASCSNLFLQIVNSLFIYKWYGIIGNAIIAIVIGIQINRA